MALLHLNFQSKNLFGNTDVNIILPDLPRETDPKTFYKKGKKYKVLWLLHGTFGDYTDWVRKSNIELYACEKELAVVMPSAQNTDYANWGGFGMGYNAYSYLTDELMPLVYAWLPISDKREDNFIAGLSMGGRGACVYALNHPEKFAAAYAMSSCPRDMRDERQHSIWKHRIDNQLNNAGGMDEYLKSEQNIWDIAAQKAKSENLPRLYFACGTKDALMYESFKKFRAYAEKINLKAQFTEVDGYSHEWRFWEKCVQDALEKLVPSKEKQGNAF